METEYFDVIIVGAGLTGIGAAKHLQDNCPSKSYAILEGRKAMGGTWDLFRYPGFRSDSDMHTLGYKFKPWTDNSAIAEGADILQYINEAAEENQIAAHIRYQQLVSSASWNSDDATWTLTIDDQSTGEARQVRCNFLLLCAGYYSYKQGYTPEFPGRDMFAGQVVHPQEWPEDLDYRGKKIVVIGSGATAVTLIPSLAERAAHVTMLQRTPTYMASKPRKDKIANILGRILPARWAYAITRWKNITLHHMLLDRARTQPEEVKEYILSNIREQLGPDFDVKKHFTPDYNPWDQRLCLAPDNDLFATLKSGAAEIVTDQIETFTRTGILLKSGETLEADIIVTATGLELVPMGEIEINVDGRKVSLPDTMSYRGLMLTGIPNSVSIMGYFNAPWTLRSEIVAEWVCRVLNHMDNKNARQVVPVLTEEDFTAMPKRPWIDGFSSGYLQRAIPQFPKQGDKNPWMNRQDYKKDKVEFRRYDLDDGALSFS